MSERTTLTIDIANNSIRDNRGNAINGNQILCDGQPVQINASSLVELSDRLGPLVRGIHRATPPSTPDQYDWRGQAQSSAPSLPNTQQIQRALAAGERAAQVLRDNVSDITLNLRNGVESPLSVACREGQANGVLQR